MTASANEDKRWSDKKKMEGEDSLRTLECLRGRLLAERQASRVAKDDAEVMGNKLIELENKLREETKLRKKAERRLKFLMTKLDSLKISPALEGSEQSRSSQNSCGFSCTSSTSSSVPKDIEPELSEPKPQNIIPVVSQDMKDNVPKTTACNQNHKSLPIEESSSTQEISISNSVNLKNPLLDKSGCESTASSQDLKADDKSSSSLKASMVEKETNTRNESDNEDNVDNTLALVPVSLPASTKTSDLKILDQSVCEVLDALRHAREKIQRSMERRHMIRVGPT